MKTSLHLTDVVVLRHEGDTVNFSGLEITKTRSGFEVKNSTDLVESFLNLFGLENSKPTANPDGHSTVMELSSATPLEGYDYSKSCTAVGKLIFMAPWRPDMQFAIQQLSTQVLNTTTESKRAVKQLIRYLKGTQHTCLRLEAREMVQTGLLGDSATPPEYNAAAQLCNTHPGSCTYMDRTGLEFLFCLFENKKSSHCHLDNIQKTLIRKNRPSFLDHINLRCTQRQVRPATWRQQSSGVRRSPTH